MPTSDTTAAAQTDTIAFEIDLHHAPAKVWRALTEPALLAEWLLPLVDGRLELGGAFTLQAPSFPGWDGRVHCRVKEIDAQRKLSYSWVVGDMELDTVVTFALTPMPPGTRLTITQSGFKPDQRKNFGGARYGWRLMGGKLEDLLTRIP